jgi:predicted HicB family RNase H-like nuclease
MKKSRSETEDVVKVATRIRRQLYKEAKILAVRDDISVQELINRALAEYVKKGGSR